MKSGFCSTLKINSYVEIWAGQFSFRSSYCKMQEDLIIISPQCAKSIIKKVLCYEKNLSKKNEVLHTIHQKLGQCTWQSLLVNQLRDLALFIHIKYYKRWPPWVTHWAWVRLFKKWLDGGGIKPVQLKNVKATFKISLFSICPPHSLSDIYK